MNTHWVLRSHYETDIETGLPLYWNNSDGWQPFPSASIFSEFEMLTINPVPDSDWVPVEVREPE